MSNMDVWEDGSYEVKQEFDMRMSRGTLRFYMCVCVDV